ncbi:MAG TPA: dTMP kinase [Bacillota bacterium]|nr:dTMP kinase [Bacillota bacterium]
MIQRGLFITLEGPDGCGKSTQLKLLQDELKKLQINHWITREPGGTTIGEEIREILLSPENSTMSPRAEMLLYAASRAQHVDEAIRPRLAAGVTVISDRYIDSSLVYQGLGLGLGIETVWQVNVIAVDFLLPDLTVVLELSENEAAARLERKLLDANEGRDRIEARSKDYHKLVSAGYNRLKEMFPDRVMAIDARTAPEQTVEKILSRITNMMEQRRKEGEL